MTNSYGSYPSIFNLGHRAVRDLLTVPHYVEEKVDGSQFSFGLVALTSPYLEQEGGGFPSTGPSHELRVRSKGAEMNVHAPEKMFTQAVETVKRLNDAGLLHPGWTYRGEYLAKKRHNALNYDRVPEGNVILFDVSTGDQEWLSPDEKRAEAARLGLECVPVLLTSDHGPATLEALRAIIDNTTSVLGGQLIEGIVVKPIGEFYGKDHKTLMGKFVSERFKEVHKHSWTKDNPTSGDILDRLAKTFTSEARWMKAVQHLREAGLLKGEPADIALLMPEIAKDLGMEEKDEIQRILWKWAWPHVQRAVTRGAPEWYKNELLRQQFEQGAE